MRILATVPLHLMDVQIEIVKAYIYFICKLAKYNQITFVICQAKKYKQFKNAGLIKRLEASGAKVVLLDKILKADKQRKQYWLMDNAKIEQVLGSDYDLVLFYAYSISAAKQMQYAFNEFYEHEELKVTFNSMLTKYRQTYPFYYLSRKHNIPTFQFIVDWLEPNIKEIYSAELKTYRFGVYKHKALGVRFMPIYDMYMFRSANFNMYSIKYLDFVFGYTITYAGRQYLHESIQNGIKEGPQVLLFASDRYWQPEARNDVVPQNEYFNYILQAKFSLVIPANNKNEFSIQRFYECISRRCIPLIDSRCVLKEVFSDKQDIQEFWENNKLIIDLSKTTINKRLKRLDYEALIKQILELPSITKLFDVGYYENFVKNFEKNTKKLFTLLR